MENRLKSGSMALVVRAEPRDTFKTIAAQFGVDESILRTANPDVKKVRDGDELVVPLTPTQCIIEEGDTLASVAAQFDTTEAHLQQMNPTVHDIKAGDVLNIP